jgi:2-keto-4-pentenoate hydratase/2-oxohepta-3-ene-1,7-dioic acid hydratase in catechol pathway
MSLVPGDVILTGTPAGARLISDGSLVEAAIEEIGSLVVSVSKG